MSPIQIPTITAMPDHAGQRVDRFLAGAIDGLSRSRLQQLIESGAATCDGLPIPNASSTVRAGAVYAILLPPAMPAVPQPERIPFTILYEDADLIVIDKPAGLVVHPAPGHLVGTLVNGLLAHCGEDLPGIGGEKRPGIVHRLDKDTSGVMVVAKTETALARLSAAFAARDLDRIYFGLCWGMPAPLYGEIAASIGRDPRDRKRMAVVTHGGKSALTRYHSATVWAGCLALLECRLATGRTHQIRVHLAHIGHPIIGDPIYLRRTPTHARNLSALLRNTLLSFPRQALHAARLGFAHPRTGKILAFETPIPGDMQALVTAIKIEFPTN